LIEKFEQEAAQALFAVAIFSGDDAGIGAEGVRARENVVFETGCFYGKLGREKVVVLREVSCTLPGDMSGVNYLEYSKGSKFDWKRLRASLSTVPELKAVLDQRKGEEGARKRARSAVCNVWDSRKQKHCVSVPKDDCETCSKHRNKSRCEEGCRKTSGHE